MKTLKIKDICDKGSSALKQKDVEGKEGKYPVFGASGYISSIDTYHQDKDYIAIVKDGSGIGRVTFMPAYSSVIGTMQYILPKEGYNIKYISYCLQSLDLAKYKQGAAIPHIYFRDYGERYVNIEESLPEQERIVSLLDAEFAKIDAIKANAEKQLQDAKALFQSALKDYLTPKEGWSYLPFEKSIVKVKKQKSIKSKDYKEVGQYPVVSQESSLISGYFDDASILYHHDIPVVIFGDHTQNVKYVDFDFIVGADGVHILSPIAEIIPKFFYYQLRSIKLRNLGYARHYKLLKLVSVGYPSLSEQHQIAEQLDKIFAKIHALQSNFDTTVTLCNDLKQSILKDIFG